MLMQGYFCWNAFTVRDGLSSKPISKFELVSLTLYLAWLASRSAWSKTAVCVTRTNESLAQADDKRVVVR